MNDVIIKKAITEAGGVEQVADHFELGPRAIRKWWQVGRVPSDKVVELCRLGKFQVKPSQIDPVSFPDYANFDQAI